MHGNEDQGTDEAPNLGCMINATFPELNSKTDRWAKNKKPAKTILGREAARKKHGHGMSQASSRADSGQATLTGMTRVHLTHWARQVSKSLLGTRNADMGNSN